MLALSPPLFSTTYGWPFEDNLLAQNLQQGSNQANFSLLIDFPTNHDHQMQHDFAPENSNSISSGGTVNDDPMKVSKRLTHNACERDRRKRVNNLYAFLRSLLPVSTDQKKKVSIPGVVSRTLKYIPELQKEVETLRIKKQKLLLCFSSTNELPDSRNRSTKVVSSVSVLDDKEVVIQLNFSSDHMNKNKLSIGLLLSKAIEYLEEEEGGLVLLNATTFKCLGENSFFSTLHFQMQGDHKIDAEKLKDNLCSLYH